MALTMKEIVKWCEQEKREFWEYMLEEDKRGNCKSVVCGGGLPCIRRGTRLF